MHSHIFNEPEIRVLTEKKLAGMSLTMSLSENKTQQLWQMFMPVRKQIINSVSSDFYSIRIYPPTYDFSFASFKEPFQKWAAVEVSDFEGIPDTMKSFFMPGGLYAVFHYKGLNTDPSVFEFIYGYWLPNSQYVIDNRPHFEILGSKYHNNDPDSEEEIWLPVRLK